MLMLNRRTFLRGCPLGAITLILCAAGSTALAQVGQRAAFVGNNGNLEGGISSFTFTPAGEPQLVQYLQLGSGSGNLLNNVYSLTLSPDGRHLAATHATGGSARVSILRINGDASMSHIGSWHTESSPLHARWISNEILGVTMSNSSSVDSRIIIYRFNENAPTLAGKFSFVGSSVVGPFCTAFEIHPNRQYIYAENGGLSGQTWVRVFGINPNGTLTTLHTEFTMGYMLGLGISPNGRWLYGGGGISAGSNSVFGYDIDATSGLTSWMWGSPYISPGSSPSPKQTVVSTDNRFVFVGHGRSAQVRSFHIDEQTGALTDSTHAFTVGGQGDLGNIAVLDDLVLFTRQYGSTAHGPAGLFSYFIEPDGSFTQRGFFQTTATRPYDVATWSPPLTACYANCDGSTVEPILNVDDFTCFITEFSAAQVLPHEQQITAYANCDGSTSAPVLNVDDFTCFIVRFSAGCP
jgi:6-phosphogluconolactonase (cycloisomerase 2 family)